MRIVLFVAGLLAFAPGLNTSLVGLAVAILVMVVIRFWNAGGPEESAARERARIAKLPAEEQLTDDQLDEQQQKDHEPLPEMVAAATPTATTGPLDDAHGTREPRY